MYPQPGDFGLVSITGHVGLAIRFGQWLNGDGFSKYTHAFIYIGNGMVVEAQPGGAVRSPLSEYDGRDILWSTGRIPLTGVQRRIIVAGAIEGIGTPYSFLDYASLALVRLGLRPRWLARYVASSGHMICSQYVDHYYLAAGVDLIPIERLSGDVTPGDLWKRLVRPYGYALVA
jgi:cell wall-associated NlpC family hydrolase